MAWVKSPRVSGALLQGMPWSPIRMEVTSWVIRTLTGASLTSNPIPRSPVPGPGRTTTVITSDAPAPTMTSTPKSRERKRAAKTDEPQHLADVMVEQHVDEVLLRQTGVSGQPKLLGSLRQPTHAPVVIRVAVAALSTDHRPATAACGAGDARRLLLGVHVVTELRPSRS